MRSVLLQLHIGQPTNCEAWSNVPCANGIQITVYTHTNSSIDTTKCAQDCYNMIERQLSTLGGIKNLAPCIQAGVRIPPPAYACSGAANGLHKRVLIYIADGSRQIDSQIEQYFTAPNSIIIPIVDSGLGPKPELFLPSSLRTKIVERMNNFNPSPLIPRILLAAGIVGERFRLFISYKHSDAAAIASQLFHALSERSFDTFLDRFSSRTGDDFVTLIREELFDKACVLVLETLGIGQSVYCRQEVSTAIAYDLGLLAIDLPHSKKTFPMIHKRKDLSDSSLESDGTLQKDDLQQVLDFIGQKYDYEVTRRFRAQDRTLLQSIQAAKLKPEPEGVGQYTVNNSQNEYLVSMCRRPPGVEDFKQTDMLCCSKNPTARGVLFGPISVVRTQRSQGISWLGQKAAIIPIDEGHVLRSLQDIALGKL